MHSIITYQHWEWYTLLIWCLPMFLQVSEQYPFILSQIQVVVVNLDICCDNTLYWVLPQLRIFLRERQVWLLGALYEMEISLLFGGQVFWFASPSEMEFLLASEQEAICCQYILECLEQQN